MLVYRAVMWDENIEIIKEKDWFIPNIEQSDDFYFVSNSNTFKKDRKEGEYLYFYAEDAIRMMQLFEDEWMHNRRKPHIAEFDIATDILAEYLELGIYKNYYMRNMYGFNKQADDYSKEEAVKILKNLDRPK